MIPLPPVTDTGSTQPVLQEVVVTAELRRQDLQRAPITADVKTGQLLQAEHVDDLQQLQLETPSLSVGEAGVTESVNIRGVGLGVSSPAVPMGVALYRDGVFQGPLLSSEPLFDMASVQVLLGPQGTFVGSNSTGGAILFTSRDPQFDRVGGYAQMWYGNYDEQGVQGAVNLPVSSRFAARLAVNEMSRDSFFEETGDVGASHRQPGNENLKNARLSLEYRPSKSLKVISKTAVNQEITDGLAHVMSTANPYYDGRPLSYDLTYNVPDTLYDQNGFRQSLQGVYTFAGGTTARLVLGYTDAESPYIDDFDSSSSLGTATLPPATGVFIDTASERTRTEEFDLISPSGKTLEWTAGVFNFWDVSEAATQITEPTPPTTFIGRTPNYKASLAGFGQVKYRIVHGVHTEVGLRYTRDRAHDTGYEMLFGVAPAPVTLDRTAYQEDAAWTGKAGVDWTLSPYQYVYAFAAKGYKSGGIVGPGSPNFAPETVYDYEAGLKSAWLGGHVRTELNGFYMDYRNMQLSSYIPPLTAGLGGANGVVNAGSSTISGFEAQLQSKFGGLGVDLGIANTDSKLGKTLFIDNTRLPAGGIVPLGPQCPAGAASHPPTCFDYGLYTQNLAGGPNPYSPKWQIDGTIDYDLEVGGNGTLTPRVSYSYTAAQYQTVLIAPANYIAAHSILDASMTYRHDEWSVEAYGTNLRNTLYIVGYTYGPSYFLGRPRQFGLRVTREF